MKFVKKKSLLLYWTCTTNVSGNKIWCYENYTYLIKNMMNIWELGKHSQYSDWLQAGWTRDQSSSHGAVKNFLFPASSSLVLGSIQPLTYNGYQIRESTSPPPYIYMAQCLLVTYRDNIYIYKNVTASSFGTSNLRK
jgi:hypothetical protein